MAPAVRIRGTAEDQPVAVREVGPAAPVAQGELLSDRWVVKGSRRASRRNTVRSKSGVIVDRSSRRARWAGGPPEASVAATGPTIPSGILRIQYFGEAVDPGCLVPSAGEGRSWPTAWRARSSPAGSVLDWRPTVSPSTAPTCRRRRRPSRTCTAATGCCSGGTPIRPGSGRTPTRWPTASACRARGLLRGLAGVGIAGPVPGRRRRSPRCASRPGTSPCTSSRATRWSAASPRLPGPRASRGEPPPRLAAARGRVRGRRGQHRLLHPAGGPPGGPRGARDRVRAEPREPEGAAAQHAAEGDVVRVYPFAVSTARGFSR